MNYRLTKSSGQFHHDLFLSRNPMSPFSSLAHCFAFWLGFSSSLCHLGERLVSVYQLHDGPRFACHSWLQASPWKGDSWRLLLGGRPVRQLSPSLSRFGGRLRPHSAWGTYQSSGKTRLQVSASSFSVTVAIADILYLSRFMRLCLKYLAAFRRQTWSNWVIQLPVYFPSLLWS